MAGPWYVDDGGDNSDGSTWAKAYQNIQAFKAAVATMASGEIVYIGHNSIESGTHTANFELVGPTAGAPAYIISATQGSNPPTYAASSSLQIDTSAGAYTLTFNGSFAVYGMSMKSGSDITFLSDSSSETAFVSGCTLKPANNKQILFSAAASYCECRDTLIDLAADSAGASAAPIRVATGPGFALLTGLTFDNETNRTATALNCSCVAEVSGCDFSGFTAATEIVADTANLTMTNCLVNATNLVNYIGGYPSFTVMAINCGSADAPTSLQYINYFGSVLSSTSVYRSGGATVEGVATGWRIITAANCSEGSPFYSPWMYGTIDSTGNKVVTVYACCVNSAPTTATLNDKQIWAEVEYLATSDSAKSSRASDQRTTILTAEANQTVETSSTWAGVTEDFRFMLEVPIAVGETGMYRCRVAVAVPSITATSSLYIDPKPVVTAV